MEKKIPPTQKRRLTPLMGISVVILCLTFYGLFQKKIKSNLTDKFAKILQETPEEILIRQIFDPANLSGRLNMANYRGIEESRLPLLIPLLQKKLKEQNSLVRLRALQIMYPLVRRDLPYIPELLDCLKDVDVEVRLLTMDILKELGPKAIDTVVDLILLSKSPNPREEMNASWALGKIGEEALPFLIKEFEKDETSCKPLFSIIGRFDPPSSEGIQFLLQIAKNPKTETSQIEAISALGEVDLLSNDLLNELLILEETRTEKIKLEITKALSRQLSHRVRTKAIRHIKDATIWFSLPRKKTAKPLKDCTEKALSVFLRNLKTSDSGLRLETLEALQRYAKIASPISQEVIDALEHLLQDKDPHIRGKAILALREMGSQAYSTVPSLLHLLRDRASYSYHSHKSSEIRELVALNLFEMAPLPESALAFIQELLQEEHSDFKYGLGNILAKHSQTQQEAFPLLIESILHTTPYTYKTFVALRHYPPEQLEPCIPDLIRLLSGTNPPTTNEAIKTLGKIGTKASVAIPILLPLLESRQLHDRINIACALLQIDPEHQTENSLSIFQEVIFHRQIYAAEDATKTIGDLGALAKPAIPILLKALKDEDLFVRIASAFALHQIDPTLEEGRQELLSILHQKKQDWIYPYKALDALAEMKVKRPEILDAIHPYLNDPNPDVQESAKLAWEALQEK